MFLFLRTPSHHEVRPPMAAPDHPQDRRYIIRRVLFHRKKSLDDIHYRLGVIPPEQSPVKVAVWVPIPNPLRMAHIPSVEAQHRPFDMPVLSPHGSAIAPHAAWLPHSPQELTRKPGARSYWKKVSPPAHHGKGKTHLVAGGVGPPPRGLDIAHAHHRPGRIPFRQVQRAAHFRILAQPHARRANHLPQALWPAQRRRSSSSAATAMQNSSVTPWHVSKSASSVVPPPAAEPPPSSNSQNASRMAST